MSEKSRAHLSILFANLIYGANYSIARIAMPQYISPSGFILLRVICATSLFVLIDLRRSGQKRIERKDYFYFFLLGLFGVAINQLLFFEGLSRTSSINAALIMTSTPILVVLMAFFMHREKLKTIQSLGIFCGLAGAILLILQYSHVTGTEGAFGDLLIFLNAASYALYLVLTKPMMKKYGVWQVIKWTFIFGTLLVIPFGAQSATAVHWSDLPSAVWWSIGFVLIFSTFFAYLLNTFGLHHLSPSIVSFYIYLQPLFATVISLFMTHEGISLLQMIACLLIFTGVYFVNRKSLVKAKS